MKPTSCKKGRSPWKRTKVRGSHAGGIVIPKGAILVNQRLGKVKLEEDYVDRKPDLHVLMEIDNANANSIAASIESDAVAVGDDFTEEFIVTKVDLGIPMSSEEVPVPSEEDVNGSLTSCQKEIESLKRTVKELRLQMDKQNEAIRKQNEIIAGMKSLIRTVGLSMVNYCEDAEKQDEGCHQVPSGQQEASEKNSVGSEAENSLPLDEPSGSHLIESERSQDNLHEKGHPRSIANVECSEDGTVSQNLDVSSNLTNVSLENVESSSSDDTNVEEDSNGNEGHFQMSQEHTILNNQRNDCHMSTMKVKSLGLKRKDSCSESEGDHGCSKCRRKFTSEAGLSLHLRQAHGEEIKCHQCAKVFYNGSSLNRHIQSIHEGVRYICAHCPATFTQSGHVRDHEKKVHVKWVQTQQCQVCGIHLKDSEMSLRSHMNNMHRKSSSRQLV